MKYIVLLRDLVSGNHEDLLFPGTATEEEIVKLTGTPITNWQKRFDGMLYVTDSKHPNGDYHYWVIPMEEKTFNINVIKNIIDDDEN